MAKKKKEEEPVDSTAWMVTFSDLLTLMLTFFVMLLSTSAVEPEEVKAAFSVFDSLYHESGKAQRQTIEAYGLFNAQGGGTIQGSGFGAHVGLPFSYLTVRKISRHADELEAMLANLADDAERKFIGFSDEEAKELKNIAVKNVAKGIKVHIPNSLFFKPGESVINPASTKILKIMEEWLQEKPYKIKVEGHSDNVKINEVSNWELSINRAVSIMRYFLDNKIVNNPERISAFGYGEFQPIAPNDLKMTRKKNSRITVVFRKPTA